MYEQRQFSNHDRIHAWDRNILCVNEYRFLFLSYLLTMSDLQQFAYGFLLGFFTIPGVCFVLGIFTW